MRKEIIVCDICKKEIKKEEIKNYFFEVYRLELCDKCYSEKEGFKSEIEKMNEDYDKKRMEVIKKYSLDNFFGMI